MRIEEHIQRANTGRKDDSGKLEWTLIPWTAMRIVLQVFQFGAKKYAPDNWKRVPNARHRYVNAAMRHLTAHLEGEILDPESEFPHLAHAAASLLMCLGLPKEEKAVVNTVAFVSEPPV
jgi:hypothetical protein